MTALEQFVRLESTGLWRQDSKAGPKEVIVSFGDASLILRDIHDYPLGHWSLPATRILKSDDTGVTYSADPDEDETLLISDPEMIRAIAMVSGAIAPQLEPGRAYPRWAPLAMVAALVALLAWYGPGVLRGYAAGSIPLSQAEAVGSDVLHDIAAISGAACNSESARPAVASLLSRLFPDGNVRSLTVMPLGDRPTASLPGGSLLVNTVLLSRLKEPDELAGYLTLEAARAAGGAPLAGLLQDTSLAVTIRLMLRGGLDGETAETVAESILADPSLPPERFDAEALVLLQTAKVSARPFSSALTRSGTDYARAVTYDVPDEAGTSPVLDDQNWVALQDICAE